MADAACVLHAFTFPSYEQKQVAEVDGLLQESVSFGRFATETLAWDKWSSFSNKRYVEEAAKHSQPGLVAKKKAFFETYYKKKALLEQENAQNGNQNHNLDEDAEAEKFNVTYPCLETVASETPAMVSEQEGAETLEADLEHKNEEAAKMELIPCREEKEAISKNVKTSLEVTEASAGNMLPICPQPPPVLRASSKKAYSVKGHRVSFKQSTEDITSPLKLIYTNSQNPQMLALNQILQLFQVHLGSELGKEKVEEILNSKAWKRVKFQTKLKDKAATQLKKLQLGFCFCSKPSLDLHDKSQAVKHHAKISVECIQLEKHRSLMMNGCWKHVEKQRSQRQIRPGSLGEAIAQKGRVSVAAQIL